jgi:iron complex outermembrane receptor protein
VTEDILVYFKTSRGFRGGEFGRNPQAPSKPETNTDYEIGLKSEFFDHRLRVNLAGYITDYNNKDVNITVCAFTQAPPPVTGCGFLGGFSTVVTNAATARLEGFEWTIDVRPIEGLTIYTTGDYANDYYTNYLGATNYTNFCFCSFNASGVNLDAEPTWQADVGARYEHPLGPGTFGIQGDVQYIGSIPITPLTIDPLTPLSIQQQVDASKTILNGRIEYRLPQDGLTFALWGTNLTNLKYGSIGLPSYYTNVGTLLPAPPLTFGVSVKYSFGKGS